MSALKNYTFTLLRKNDRAGIHHSLTIKATARTLAEAQSDFRHHLRVHHPEILDSLEDWGYRCEVCYV